MKTKKKKRLAIWIDAETLDTYRELAEKHGMTMAAQLRADIMQKVLIWRTR